MNKNIFCSRKGGATVRGKFFPLVTSGILSDKIEREANTRAARRKKAKRRAARR